MKMKCHNDSVYILRKLQNLEKCSDGPVHRTAGRLHTYIPCAVVRECVACKARCVGRRVASAGDGVPQQTDPSGNVHVHLTGTQEGFP